MKKQTDNIDEVYEYFNEFVEMLNNENSYIRTRGIVLISSNAKWDSDNIRLVLSEIMQEDEKDKIIFS